MSKDRITSIDVNKAMDKMLETLKAYYGKEDGYMYAYATLAGTLAGMTYGVDQKTVETIVEQFNNKTEETMHKLTLEALSAKEVQSA